MTAAIDIRHIKDGDTVKFRCGGFAYVWENQTKDIPGLLLSPTEKDRSATRYKFNLDGTCRDGVILLDIVEVIPRPLEARDLKPGMAFFDSQEKENIVWYSGPAVGRKGAYVFENLSGPIYVFEQTLKYGLRCPEKDIHQ